MPALTGTGLLSYIRPVDEGLDPPGLNEFRAYRPYHPFGLGLAHGLIRFSIRRSDLLCHRVSQILRNRG